MAKRPKRSDQIRTRSGRTVRVNRSLGERWTGMRDDKLRRKVERMRGLPKSRLKRLAWYLSPSRLRDFWFSRDGAIAALKIVGIGILALFILALGVFAFFRRDLPNITDISGSDLGGSLSFYDRTGKILLWQDNVGSKRVPVPSDQISKYMKQATVAVEDKTFYTNHGFDLRGVARATVDDLLHHGTVQGGSTITEQLVKLTQDFHQNRNLALKVKELILAVEVDRTYSKDQILTGYLNAAPYGGIDYGVQVAASDYFHENAKDLTLAQAAFLAAIPQSPAYYSPYDKEYFDQAALAGRTNYILDQMVAQHMVSKTEANAAKKVDVLAQVHPQQTKYSGIQAPYFVLAAESQLERDFAAQSAKVGGWKIITTLDMTKQRQSEKAVQANLSNVLIHGGDEEATVTEDVQTGQMLALVGGVDFNNPGHGKINYAQWPISPGSSIKPYDYSALIQNTNAGAGSVLYDVVAPLPGYPCTVRALPPNGNCLWDFDRRSPGALTIRYALGGSRNIPAVKATLSVVPGDTQASINKVDKLADAMMDGSVGYHCYQPGTNVVKASASDQMDCTPSSGIGDGGYLHLDQHLNGLSTLGRMGQALPATYILKIYKDASSKPFYSWTPPKTNQVMNPQTAYILNNMLSDPAASYLGSYYKFQHYKGWDVAVKTGTTNDNYDGLMMAWSTKYAVGTWVGYHTRTQALNTEMEYVTEPVTRTVIQEALDSAGTPANWKQPAGIQTFPAYRSALPYAGQGPAVTTDIFPSWYKPKSIVGQTTSVIDKVSGKLATSCTPALAKQTVGGSSRANAYSIDIFYPPGGNSNSSYSTLGSDNVHSCNPSDYPAVSVTVTDNNSPPANPNAANSCTGSCTITAAPTAGKYPLDDPKRSQFPGTVNILVNGSIFKTFHTKSGGPYSFTYKVTGKGHQITVTAQVIDSVLYDSTSDPVTVTTSKGP